MLRAYSNIALPALGLFLIIFVSISIYNFFQIKKWKKYNIKKEIFLTCILNNNSAISKYRFLY